MAASEELTKPRNNTIMIFSSDKESNRFWDNSIKWDSLDSITRAYQWPRQNLEESPPTIILNVILWATSAMPCTSIQQMTLPWRKNSNTKPIFKFWTFCQNAKNLKVSSPDQKKLKNSKNWWNTGFLMKSQILFWRETEQLLTLKKELISILPKK